MTQRKIISLSARLIRLELNATTPERRKYWNRQFHHLRKLARRTGWID